MGWRRFNNHIRQESLAEALGGGESIHEKFDDSRDESHDEKGLLNQSYRIEITLQ